MKFWGIPFGADGTSCAHIADENITSSTKAASFVSRRSILVIQKEKPQDHTNMIKGLILFGIVSA
jgi:hypothetical protein